MSGSTVTMTMLLTALTGRTVIVRPADGLTAETGGMLACVEVDGSGGYHVRVDTQRAGKELRQSLLHEAAHVCLGHVDDYASVPMDARPALETAADRWAATHAADLERLCWSMFGCEFTALVD